ncbi:MAG TPA: energy transducer TonB [Burkholderiaceae bacterium]
MVCRFLSTCLAAVILTNSAVAAQAPGSGAADSHVTYALRDAVTGSLIRQDRVTASVPFNKRYDELTAEQKAVLRQESAAAKPTDETPFPSDGLRHLVNPLMRLAEHSGMSGPLVASAEVDAQGHALSVSVRTSPDPSMTELAQVALLKETYRPARCDGQPCAMTYVLRVTFLPSDTSLVEGSW